MTEFNPNTAHVLPNEVVKRLARVCATFNAALVNATGCVEQGDGTPDLAVMELPGNVIATMDNPELKPDSPASNEDCNAVAAYAQAHAMRVVFADAEQAQRYLGRLTDGGRLSTVSIPEDTDPALYSAEVVAA